MKNKLFKLSLIISFLGVLFLLVISAKIQPKQVNSYEELRLNTNVKTQGKILEIRTYGDFSVIRLDSNLTVTCNCIFSQNSSVEVIGEIEVYKNQKQIKAEKISKVI